MLRALFTAILFLGPMLIFLSWPMRSDAGITCETAMFPYAVMSEVMQEEGQYPVATMMDDAQTALQVWADEATGRWAIILILNEGVGCFVVGGNANVFTHPAPTPGAAG